MRLGLVVNRLGTEEPLYTTTVLAREAARRGHEVLYVELEGFRYEPHDALFVQARVAPPPSDDAETFLARLRDEAPSVWTEVGELDLLCLRNDPADDLEERPWAPAACVVFGQLAAARGVAVVNGPDGLARALTKLYFQYLPSDVRPRALISRDHDEIASFVRSGPDRVVLKPLQGSGGRSVFLAARDDDANLHQMIEAVRRDGYVIAQEYLPAAAEGDIRLFLLEGKPLEHDGRYAAIRRRRAPEDLRSNMTAGGTGEAVTIGDRELALAERVRPRLEADDMFFVGLDIVGDKLIEVNVFSPGGLHSAEQLHGAPFGSLVVDALERRAGRGGV